MITSNSVNLKANSKRSLTLVYKILVLE